MQRQSRSAELCGEARIYVVCGRFPLNVATCLQANPPSAWVPQALVSNLRDWLSLLLLQKLVMIPWLHFLIISGILSHFYFSYGRCQQNRLGLLRSQLADGDPSAWDRIFFQLISVLQHLWQVSVVC